MLDSRPVVEGKLDNAAKVARDGYTAMMNGDDMIVSGFRNKVTVAMASITSDQTLADKMKEKQAPVERDN